MLTVAEETLGQLAAERGKDVSTHLFGQEINAETYAICTADLLLKGEGEAADNIVGGPEHSTLANDAFPSREFDFMLSNPSPRGLGGDTRRAGRQRSRGGRATASRAIVRGWTALSRPLRSRSAAAPVALRALLRRRRFLNLLPHLDTPSARTLSQSSVQENSRAQETGPGRHGPP